MPAIEPSFQQIVVIGASTDGVAALKEIAHDLPADFGAPVLVVLHVGKDSQLPSILARVANVPVLYPFDGETLYPGRMYVARPEQQMRVGRGRFRITPDWADHHRPSIDELFESAAAAYGAGVIGIVLTGYLKDGAQGLKTIKDRGGIAIVQDPLEAGVPQMPLAAEKATAIDYRCKLAEIGPLLHRLVRR
jgi:two-component system, chemotaxis family, protein-glutamate methylesterase/glutaminase